MNTKCAQYVCIKRMPFSCFRHFRLDEESKFPTLNYGIAGCTCIASGPLPRCSSFQPSTPKIWFCSLLCCHLSHIMCFWNLCMLVLIVCSYVNSLHLSQGIRQKLKQVQTMIRYFTCSVLFLAFCCGFCCYFHRW